ncbi:MAG: hypothetical protein V3R60_01115, partial [Acidobacteriota bacterium]
RRGRRRSEREFPRLCWDLISSWTKYAGIGVCMIDAWAETMASQPTLRPISATVLTIGKAISARTSRSLSFRPVGRRRSREEPSRALRIELLQMACGRSEWGSPSVAATLA